MSDRGVSVTVNYVLSLAITTVLISGLLFATANIMEDRRETVLRGELEVVGERISAGIETADRLHRTGAGELVLEVAAPDRVAGEGYAIEVNASRRVVILETADPPVVVEVPFHNETAVVSSTVTGGDVEIVRSGAELEVRST